MLNFPVTQHSILLACEEGEILFDSLFISLFFYSQQKDMARNVFLSRLNAMQSISIINVHHKHFSNKSSDQKPVVVIFVTL